MIHCISLRVTECQKNASGITWRLRLCRHLWWDTMHFFTWNWVSEKEQVASHDVSEYCDTCVVSEKCNYITWRLRMLWHLPWDTRAAAWVDMSIECFICIQLVKLVTHCLCDNQTTYVSTFSRKWVGNLVLFYFTWNWMSEKFKWHRMTSQNIVTLRTVT